jgi:uncharacterized protein (DUF885 family)
VTTQAGDGRSMVPDEPRAGAAETVRQLADELGAALLDANPMVAGVLGLPGWDDKLPDYTEAGDSALSVRVGAIATRARAVDPTALDAEQQVTRAVVVQQAEGTLTELAARAVEYTVSDSDFGPVTGLLGLLSMVSVAQPAQADGYLTRLAGIPGVLAAIAERHRAGIAAGRLPIRDHVDATLAYVDRYLANPGTDPLLRPEPPADGPVDRRAFQASRDRLLADRVRPALAAYRDTLAADVRPHGRPLDRGGLCWLPDGAALYAGLARMHTTTEHPPQHWHDTGLELISGLAQEYAEVGARALGTSDLGEIFTRLRTDPALRWRDGAELLAAARTAIDRAERAAAGWFGRLPAQRCTVEPTPAHAAPGAAPASYLPPALDGTRPGIFFANTYQATERNRTIAEATAFHEAVPGHHFQITLAMERTDLPLLRRLPVFTAYLEGWGLYAERLADEMGLYSDDLARLGMLTADSMRAGRLVVDTGMHSLGWSRQQARDYLRETTPMPAGEIDQETDRYLASPGQALAYMAGRLEIQRIRAQAQERLGDRFDIRCFHDAVLGSGPVPLTVLDDIVAAWVAGRAA